MYFVFNFFLLSFLFIFRRCEILFILKMDVQQNAASESNQVLAVFDGLLPTVWPLFCVMIFIAVPCFPFIDILLLHKHASVGF